MERKTKLVNTHNFYKASMISVVAAETIGQKTEARLGSVINKARLETQEGKIEDV